MVTDQKGGKTTVTACKRFVLPITEVSKLKSRVCSDIRIERSRALVIVCKENTRRYGDGSRMRRRSTASFLQHGSKRSSRGENCNVLPPVQRAVNGLKAESIQIHPATHDNRAIVSLTVRPNRCAGHYLPNSLVSCSPAQYFNIL